MLRLLGDIPPLATQEGKPISPSKVLTLLETLAAKAAANNARLMRARQEAEQDRKDAIFLALLRKGN